MRATLCCSILLASLVFYGKYADNHQAFQAFLQQGHVGASHLLDSLMETLQYIPERSRHQQKKDFQWNEDIKK